MLTTLRTLRITLATVGLFVLVLCCDVGAQSVTPEAVEQHVRAMFSAWAAGDLVKACALDPGAVGFGFRARAARSAMSKSECVENVRSFLASLEYDRPTLDELHTAVDGDIGLAWGFYTEEFKARGREPEGVRARFTWTLKHETSGWRGLLYHRDIQPFDEKGRYIAIRKKASDRAEQTVPHRQLINAPGVTIWPNASSAGRAGGLLFLSGVIGVKPGTRDLVAGGIGPETRQALESIRAVLRSANATLDDVVKCTVFLADFSEAPAMNEVYREFFPSDRPARTTVQVAGLARGARIEIDCVAAAP